ncbi:hypothetical protein, partial [Streptomyces sp. NPDC093223]|uniref:hypothetical protein n=1 Tax=Streptomyces sp. NPDC093223 TaxID=3366033 RepID=UPI00380EAB26
TILLDDKYATDYPWAWPGNAEESRGSYLEDKEWGELLKYTFEHPTDPNPSTTLISRKAIEQNEVALAAKGDPNKFFVLSGNVDSTLAIPDAANDVFSRLGQYGSDDLPYMLYLAHEHNLNLLAKLEGPWRYSNIARNTNVVQLDYINMGGHRADGSVIGSGDLPAAVIANNTPPTAPGALMATQRRTDGSWTKADALPGPDGAVEFNGGERSVTTMSNGDLQYLAYDKKGHLYHNIRYTNGSWQGWNRVNSDATDNTLKGGALSMTSTPNGDMHVVSVAGGVAQYKIRHSTSWSDWMTLPVTAQSMSIAGTSDGRVQVAALDNAGNLMLGELRSDGGTASPGGTGQSGGSSSGTSIVNLRKLDAPTPGTKVALIQNPNNVLEIAMIGSDKRVYWTTVSRYGPTGRWSSPLWQDQSVMLGTDVALSSLPQGSTQLAIIGLDGNVWSTVGGATGTWSPVSAVSGTWGPLAATGVSLTRMADGSTYTLAGAR